MKGKRFRPRKPRTSAPVARPILRRHARHPRRSGQTARVEKDTRVQIVCQNDRSAYLSLGGRADLVRDRAKIGELWKEPFRAWFSEGKDDPEIVLIEVRPEEGEFWDNEGLNKIKYLFAAATAYAAGKKPEVDEGEQHSKAQF